MQGLRLGSALGFGVGFSGLGLKVALGFRVGDLGWG